MQAVKHVGSKIELALAKDLWSKGYRYRKNNKAVYGKPDLTFKKLKIAIFIDGEFWDGKNWEIRKHDRKSNQAFWLKKIERNIQRDKEVNEKLGQDGWQILRFLENDIEKNLRDCIQIIINHIDETKRNNCSR